MRRLSWSLGRLVWSEEGKGDVQEGCKGACRKKRSFQVESLESRELLSISPVQAIDNQSTQYHEVGNWASWNDTNAYQGNFRYHAAGTGQTPLVGR